MTIKLYCDKSYPPLGALLAANLINSTKSSLIKVEWGQKNSIENSSTEILCETVQELLRTVAQVCKGANLYGASPLERTQIDHWLCYTVGPLASKNEFSSALSHINKVLGPVTYVVGNKISIADLAIFACLFGNKQWQTLLSKKAAPSNVLRWYKFIESQDYVRKGIDDLTPALLEALKKSSEGTSNENEQQLTAGGRAREGKFVELPGAEMGKVVVRFPPEASGYLHIGHAKAALLNQYYQQAFDGKLVMRFDDTNPAKEDTHFEEVILEDVAMLEIKPDRFTYTSDYFDLFLEYCEKMIKDGNAYVDDTEPEVMKQEREQKVESANRSNSVEKNFKMWENMKQGSEYGQKCCVRAKIDMKSLNGCMRDPTIYRCKNEAHPRTGTKYRVYPTYDFACPIVDSIEGVTHTLRTMEYHDRDPQFYWFIDVLGLRKPYIWEYSRLSMTNTVLSKRKLTWFVEQGLVDGWDDPRMPTVRGVLRKGMTVEGLKEFIIAQGSSRSVVFMEWDKIWAFNKKVIDPIAPRYTVIDFDTHVPVTVKGAKEECLTVPKHPKNGEIGMKSVWVGPKLLIDKADAECLKEGENATFVNWGNLMIKKINRKDGMVLSVEAEPNLDNKEYKKTVKLTFLCDTPKAQFTHTFCVYFDHIISKPLLGKDEDFKQYVGHETRKDLQVLGDPELKNLKQGDIIQIQRRGFFRVDVPYGERSPFTCKEQPIILFYIPDGSAKDNSFAALAAKQDKPVKKEEKSTTKVPTAEVKAPENEAYNKSAETINDEIIKQGNEVRDLKAKKASKTEIDAAVKALLSLKADYKQVTAAEWKPGCVPPKTAEVKTSENKASTKSAETINEEIIKQGNEVRDLKSKKAAKAEIDSAVKVLLSLKADYKQVAGAEWKPGCVPPKTAEVKTSENKASTKSAETINEEIVKQGNEVRDLKSKKAAKAEIDSAVKVLLSLKADYKQVAGAEWKPGCVPPKSAEVKTSENKTSTKSAETINEEIVKQGNEVRDLKSKKAAKAEIDSAVKVLLSLKADYKQVAGAEWKPGCVPPKSAEVKTSENKGSTKSAETINEEIVKQGNEVRDLKAKKAAKAEIDSAVKVLLSLKAEYKQVAGAEWKPGCIPPKSSEVKVTEVKSETKSAESVNEKVIKQGNVVRDLKAKKAAKADIDEAVKLLLSLKADYKELAGAEWKPGCTPPKSAEVKSPEVQSQAKSAESVNEEIIKQGNVVRDLKAKKASKTEIDAAVKVLLSLKADYKQVAGVEWKPGCVPPKSTERVTKSESTKSADSINEEITKQGNIVRDLKSNKADKSKIDAEVKILLKLKEEFKSISGKDWKPDMKTTPVQKTETSVNSSGEATNAEGLTSQINEQGTKVRDLKTKKASKEEIEKEVAVLLNLKAEYKKLTGTDFPTGGRSSNDKPAKQPKEKKENKPKQQAKENAQSAPNDDKGVKKQTRLGLEAKKEEDLPNWYSQVLTKSEMIEYYDVSGCYIYRPWSYNIWEEIKNWLDKEIKKLGVENCYFPIFVSKAMLEKEKSHIADFSPEVAWVTKSGDSEMSEPVAVRPTSETVMYPAYAKWIQSYRDLPIKLNQWNNVVRWEFKHPQPFLRTREFLWQEGHTAYATFEEAKDEVSVILDLYARVYTDLLAVPVIKGRKTEKEKFAGGVYTYTVEAYISASGRAIQGATSHHLGQNFSKMFELTFEDPETQEKKYVYQNSWGITTRTIGVMIMIHSDNQGLVLPPNIASVQAVIVPCGITTNLSEEGRANLQSACSSLESELKSADVRVKGDYRDNYSPGWKFNHWELKGVPIRIELGPKDIEKKQLVAVRRDTGEKLTIPLKNAVVEIKNLLNKIHENLYSKACEDLNTHLATFKEWSDFIPNLEKKNLNLVPFCGSEECEDRIKADSTRDDGATDTAAPSSGAKSLCIPLEQPTEIKDTDKCIHPSCRRKPQFYTLFGRSY